VPLHKKKNVIKSIYRIQWVSHTGGFQCRN